MPQVNKATLGLLTRVEPYVAFGYPNLKSVRELIYKRGYAKVRDHGARDWERAQPIARPTAFLTLPHALGLADQQQPHPTDGQQDHRGGAKRQP